MNRALAALITVLFALSAFAQSKPEPATETASPLAVVVFLVGFGGAIVGYFVYLWVNNRKTQRELAATGKPAK